MALQCPASCLTRSRVCPLPAKLWRLWRLQGATPTPHRPETMVTNLGWDCLSGMLVWKARLCMKSHLGWDRVHC